WGNLKGRPLDERGLARRLRQFGIKSKNVRTDAGVPKGYMRADFEDAWRRYLPPSPGRSATSATSATIVNIQRADVANDRADVAPAADVVAPVAASRGRNAGNINAVADVADVADLAAMGRATKPADDIPDFLLRQPDPNGGSGHRCDHCGALGAAGRWSWPGRPDGIWLHPRCEAPWFDSEGRQGVQ